MRQRGDIGKKSDQEEGPHFLAVAVRVQLAVETLLVGGLVQEGKGREGDDGWWVGADGIPAGRAFCSCSCQRHTNTYRQRIIGVVGVVCVVCVQCVVRT